MYPYFARKVEQSWPFQWDRLYLYRQKSPYLPHIFTVCMIQNAPKKKQSKSNDSNKKFTQFCDQLNYYGIIGNFMLRNRIYMIIHTVMYECHNVLNLLPPPPPPGQNGRHFTDGILGLIFGMKSFVFWLRCYWSLSLKVQSTLIQHWFSHYLNQCLTLFTDGYMRH